jgi:hypothetical protein
MHGIGWLRIRKGTGGEQNRLLTFICCWAFYRYNDFVAT